MSKSIKKRYLKALNRQLKKETAGKFESAFVFYPLGAKPKNATGVTGSPRCAGPGSHGCNSGSHFRQG
ncbi:hypothetical protein [Cupriavidus taiwanensis]|uniref:Uncharacterized protein n=1 Tax=Cupriavidus taiwanensis TaxID=164546 RepID=A0A7Z7NRJ3_9BURK|nr:hypothetical protein [Cupriavidus taiwanensis]SOZ17534.1 conserved hypothetical protein [Cupriavidus taiwanensis]SOZ96259.1 conserved hypothetical protein [Cupriavidus taiwanensis]SPC25775.1 conserved hypothetical protein [Cupriavidus taiwanensis]